MDPVPGHGADDSLCLPRSARGSLILYAKRACTKKNHWSRRQTPALPRGTRELGQKSIGPPSRVVIFIFIFPGGSLRNCWHESLTRHAGPSGFFFTDKKTPSFLPLAVAWHVTDVSSARPALGCRGFL